MHNNAYIRSTRAPSLMIYDVDISAEQILRSDRSWRSLLAGAYSMTAARIIPRQKVANRLLSYVEKQKTRAIQEIPSEPSLL